MWEVINSLRQATLYNAKTWAHIIGYMIFLNKCIPKHIKLRFLFKNKINVSTYKINVQIVFQWCVIDNREADSKFQYNLIYRLYKYYVWYKIIRNATKLKNQIYISMIELSKRFNLFFFYNITVKIIYKLNIISFKS